MEIIRRKTRIGWVIGDQVDRGHYFRRVDLSVGGSGLVRYQWLAEQINKDATIGLHHEIYKPWRRYSCVVFVKAMGERTAALMRSIRREGLPTIFDSNVNYYQLGGREYYTDMLPTPAQKDQAIEMTEGVTAVIADSEYIAERCRRHNVQTVWIPDNVRTDLVPTYNPYTYSGGKLRLLWSGQAVKLFELLNIESVLRKFASHLQLVIITNSLTAMERIAPDIRRQIHSLLGALQVQTISYENPVQLFQVYSKGGICISPRFLDSPYNMGHTEWKISLAMACGRLALVSPVPSYQTVFKRALGVGIRVLRTSTEWETVFEDILSGRLDFEQEEQGALDVVTKFYSTNVIARQHSDFLHSVINQAN